MCMCPFARYGGDQAAFGRKGITGRRHLIRGNFCEAIGEKVVKR